MAKKPKQDDPEQSQRFVETAREHGANLDSDEFGRMMDTLPRSDLRQKPERAAPARNKKR